MSVGNRAIIGLALGLAAGAAAAASSRPWLLDLGRGVEVAGSLWINAILMTIIPLVVSKIVVSIAGAGDPRTVGRAGGRAGLLFLGLLTATAILTASVMPAVFERMPVDPAATAALREGARSAAQGRPAGAAEVVIALVPANAIRSAADGAIVPLLVFTIAFAFGASRIREELRHPLVLWFRAVDEAIGVLLRWIVAASPYGVFALGVGLAIRVGVGIVTALAYYVVVSSVTLAVLTIVLYGVVYVGTRLSPRQFGRAAAPAQVVAFGTHSSAASLPAMLDGAAVHLKASPTAIGFVLPLSLAVFKYSGPIWFLVVTSFVARLYGIDIDASHLVGIVTAAVLTSFAIGAVPSGAAVAVAPVLTAAGLPLEAMGLLLAVDPLPNAFRTAANVTGMLAVTALADGRRGSSPSSHT